MRKLTQSQKDEMRARLLDIMEHRLPPLRTILTPDSTKEEPWFRESGIEKILKKYAFFGAEMRAHNGKSAPAFMAWLMDEKAGKFNKDIMVIGATSGNWGMASGLIAPMFDVKGFSAVIERTVPKGKQNQLIAAGAEIIYAPDGVSSIEHAQALAEKYPEQYHFINQYIHEGSVLGHKWPMDHIARELARLGETPSIFAATTGTCSTIMAAKRYLKSGFPQMKILGVASMSNNEKVHGSRSPEGLAELKKFPGSFQYEDIVDFPLMTGITKREAYVMSAEFYQQYYHSLGPTSMLLEAGTYRFLKDHWERHGNFDALKNKNGEIVMVSFFMDMHLPYLDDPDVLAAFAS